MAVVNFFREKRKRRSATGKPAARAMGGLSEADVQRNVLKHLKERGRKDIVYWSTPNGGKRHVITATLSKQLGELPGAPDLNLLMDGRYHGLELKADRGRFPDEQEALHEQIRASGGFAAVAFGLDEALAQLEAWGFFDRARPVRDRLLLDQ